ncbi:MAG: CopD family protein [Polyangiaceae bacterium]|nr:CopD family protein [Polyangiaceae bacterium]
MAMQLLLRSLHLFGAILWVGGISAVAIVAVALPERVQKEAIGAVRGAVTRVATPGMILSFIGGLGMLLPNFTTVYARQGWMHAKLLLVIVAAGLTGAISGSIRKAAAGDKALAVGSIRGMGLALALIGLFTVILAIFRPF